MQLIGNQSATRKAGMGMDHQNRPAPTKTVRKAEEVVLEVQIGVAKTNQAD